MSDQDAQEAGVTADPARDPRAVVQGDRACTKCGYNLRGIPESGQCPECGQPVMFSLRGTLLEHAGPEYLASLGSGLSIILAGIAAIFVVALAQVPVPMIKAIPQNVSMAVLQMLQMALTLMLLVGYWRFTSLDPGFTGRESPNAARQVMRITISVQAATLPFYYGLALLQRSGIGAMGSFDDPFWVGSQLAGLVWLAAWVTQFFAVLRYVQWLARRVPDAYIFRRTQVYAWLLPLLATVGCVAVGLGPLIAMVMYWNLLDRLRKHIRAIRATGKPAALPKMAG